ncbi:MAG: DUF3300 domain-containing protein [Gemmatimonadaceae bacterium]
MMRRRVVIPALLLASLAAIPTIGFAQYGNAKAPPVTDASQRFSATQIDNLVGPVALYPDALLAQVLVAATFPDQIQDAADFVRAYGTDSIDVQSWDISVKAVAHYPSALNTMADKIDWTSALGKAYATQSSDVMASVQRLRKMAADQGNLNSSPQQNVVRTADNYQIVPAETRVIYVPVYDPYVIYSRPVFTYQFSSRYWSFGLGFPIGGWLIYDCDWGLRRVYYNGWSPTYYGFGGGWRQRSRPYIQVTNIYINQRYANVYVNRNVVSRSVNYYNVDRYASVHSGRYFDTRHDGRYDSHDNGRRPNSRYAVRSDGNNGNHDAVNRNDGGAAVRGGGYRSGGSQTSSADNNGNNNPARDGSGYGGRNDANRNGNGDANRDGNGSRDGNGNRTGGGNRGGNNAGNNNTGNNNGASNGNTDARDGNGNRVRQANPRGTPPQGRRNEPAARSENQPVLSMPRRNEPQQQPPPVLQTPAPSQAPVSVPRAVERSGGGSGRFSVPQEQRPQQQEQRPQQQERRPQPQAPEQRRAEPVRTAPPQTVRGADRGSDAKSADSKASPRTARPRGS